MRNDEITVIGVASIDDVAWSIDDDKKAKKLILMIDEAQADVGFTEDIIVALIKAMKKEYKGHKEEMDDFRFRIQSALK